MYRNNKDNILIKDHNKKYCTVLKRVIIEAKKLYFNNQIITSSSKVKIAWKIIKNNPGNSQSYPTVTKINSEEGILSDNKEIANAFNKFYIQVAKILNNELTSTCIASLLLRKIKVDNITEMKVIPVSEVEIKYTIISLRSKTSAGYDGISNNILKHFMNCIP